MPTAKNTLVLCILLAAPLLAAEDQPTREAVEFFESKIRPILMETCINCHGPKKQQAGLRMDSRAAVIKGGTEGPVVVPGDPEKSALVKAIRYGGEVEMPPKKKLPQNQIDALTEWVRMGLPWPAEKNDTAAQRAKLWREHWAFQPVRDPAPPKVKNKKEVLTPIDNFVLAKLEANKLDPSPLADRRTLIRRASFDLTGLPPAPVDVEAFEKDKSSDAYPKLIEKLLSSPQYGERWGRHWLDVARYADSKGYTYDREERRFIHAYAYRDWVIKAFNADMPYDQFLQYQIAADAICKDDSSRENLAAMGYLTLGRRFLNNMHDIIDDRIDTVMRGTQALTAGCARCHDHKFDPIATKEYYGLYGVFMNCGERNLPLVLKPQPTPDYVAFEKGLQEREKKLNDKFTQKRDECSNRLRKQSVMYLVALLDVKNLPSEEFYTLLSADEINPFVVRQWQAAVHQTRNGAHPIFAPWHALIALPEKEFAAKAASVLEPFKAQPLNARVAKAILETPPASMKETAERYGKLFADVHQEWQAQLEAAKKEKRDAPDKLADAAAEELRQFIYGPRSPASVPNGAITDVEFFLEESARVEINKLQAEIDRWIINSRGAPPYAQILEDTPVIKPARILLRGNPKNRGDDAPRQSLSIVSNGQPQVFQNGSGRLELAQSITNRANPMTARVMANRIWQWHFGTGLVATPSDFGTRSEPPTHPELLDFLASRLMERWSVKDLHRLIMLSHTYQQSSADSDAGLRADPDNKLLWRMNRQRLDFESMRDTLLSASGQLDLKMGGPPQDTFGTRRSVYNMVDRTNLPRIVRVFDFPNPDMHSPQRFFTTVPQQALFMLNSSFISDRAKALIARKDVQTISDPAKRIQAINQIVFQHNASPSHLEAALQFVSSAAEPAEPPPPPPPAPSKEWAYGYGEYDLTAKKVVSFTKLPHFTGDSWQGGESWPDSTLGWARLTGTGGHTGNDLQHSVIRRWTAPADGTYSVSAKLTHLHAGGEGIRGYVFSSRGGELGQWTLHNKGAQTDFANLELKAGDTLDFIVDMYKLLNNNEFTWAPVIKSGDKAWDTAKDFGTERPKKLQPLNVWEKYAQVLLMSNEFMFVD